MDPLDGRILLAENIRSLAAKRGISIRELAASAGVSRGYIDRVLAGQSSPTVDWVCKLSQVLSCRPRLLLL